MFQAGDFPLFRKSRNVGGDTVDECVPVVRTLRRAKQGVLFAYAVEVHENDAVSASNGHERAVAADPDDSRQRGLYYN